MIPLSNSRATICRGANPPTRRTPRDTGWCSLRIGCPSRSTREPYTKHAGRGGPWDNVGAMEHAGRLDVAKRVADLLLAEPYARALLTIRGYTAGFLDIASPREALYEDFERARGVLGGQGAPEEAEDAVVDVKDFAVGSCAPHTKL